MKLLLSNSTLKLSKSHVTQLDSTLMEYAYAAVNAHWIYDLWTFSEAYKYLKFSYFDNITVQHARTN